MHWPRVLNQVLISAVGPFSAPFAHQTRMYCDRKIALKNWIEIVKCIFKPFLLARFPEQNCHLRKLAAPAVAATVLKFCTFQTHKSQTRHSGFNFRLPIIDKWQTQLKWDKGAGQSL